MQLIQYTNPHLYAQLLLVTRPAPHHCPLLVRVNERNVAAGVPLEVAAGTDEVAAGAPHFVPVETLRVGVVVQTHFSRRNDTEGHAQDGARGNQQTAEHEDFAYRPSVFLVGSRHGQLLFCGGLMNCSCESASGEEIRWSRTRVRGIDSGGGLGPESV